MAKKSRTREAKQRRQKQQRQNQQRMILVGIVVVAVLVIALIVTSNQPAEAYIPPEILEKYDEFEYSLSLEGYPRIGDPDAPVTIEEYASFSCPGCEAFHSSSFNSILERVQTGQVLFTYVPLQTGSIPNAQGAARTALCAGQQGMFWEMHDVLYEWHTLYGNTAFSQNRLLAGVDALGMNSGSFNSCFNSQSISDVLDEALAEGVASTPTIDVNGVRVQTSEGGGIPSANEILAAVDNATPNDWTPNTTETEDPEEDEPEVTQEAGTQDSDTDEATEVPATDNDESELSEEATEEADTDDETEENVSDDEPEEPTPEATEEVDE